MKRCPECRRDYYDDSLRFCLDDGTPLLDGPGAGGSVLDEPPTAILPAPREATTGFTEAPTRAQVYTTDDKLPSRTAKGYKTLPFGILALLIVAGGAFAVYKYSPLFKSRSTNLFASPQNLKFTRLTSGSVFAAVISPDGKYVAYSTVTGDKTSIRMRQIATTTDVEIVPPPASGSFMGMSFTPDGNYLYYTYFGGPADGHHALYRIPALGGSPAKLADKLLYQNPAVSPDGKTLAYIGKDFVKKESYLFVAKTDGSDERPLIKLTEPNDFDLGLSWSPDGKEIAFCLLSADEGKRERKIVAASIADGTERPLSDRSWDRCSSIVWLAEGSLLVSGNTGSTGTDSTVNQLWMITPDSAPQRITNDLNGYSNLSATTRGDIILATTGKRISNLWVAPETDAKRAVQVPDSGEVQFINWTPDGKFVYATRGHDIWTMNADGTDQKQLTSDQGTNFHPSMTADGRYIVFASNRTGGIFHIFRMNADGRDQRQLTDGSGENFPRLSPDGRSVYYVSNVPNREGGDICKVPIDGGDALVVLKVSGDLRTIDVSPLNGMIAYRGVEKGQEKSKIEMISADGGDILRTLPMPPSAQAIFHFTPDGRAIAFQDSRLGGSNLWAIDLDGKGESKPLTDFKGEAMDFSFAWSPDGKQLAVIRYNRVTDTVLITAAK